MAVCHLLGRLGAPVTPLDGWGCVMLALSPMSPAPGCPWGPRLIRSTSTAETPLGSVPQGGRLRRAQRGWRTWLCPHPVLQNQPHAPVHQAGACAGPGVSPRVTPRVPAASRGTSFLSRSLVRSHEMPVTCAQVMKKFQPAHAVTGAIFVPVGYCTATRFAPVRQPLPSPAGTLCAPWEVTVTCRETRATSGCGDLRVGAIYLCGPAHLARVSGGPAAASRSLEGPRGQRERDGGMDGGWTHG